MILWGAIWGAVLGWLWPASAIADLRVGIGAVLGAAAGWSFRQAVRQELARWASGYRLSAIGRRSLARTSDLRPLKADSR